MNRQQYKAQMREMDAGIAGTLWTLRFKLEDMGTVNKATALAAIDAELAEIQGRWANQNVEAA